MNKTSKKITREVYLGIVLSLFSVFFLLETNKMNIRAAKYPRIILVTLLVLSVGLLIQGIYYSIYRDKYEERHGKDNKEIGLAVFGHPLIVFGLIVIYLALFHFTNFFIATAIFTPLVMLWFGERRILPILLTTIGIDLFVYVVFVLLLKVHFAI